MRRWRLLLWPAGVAVGVAAESAAYGWDAARDWPDLVTGWALIACGLVAWSRRPSSLAGALLAASGFAWFAPNFADADSALVAWAAGHALYLHRGPLVQLLVTYPSGRPRGRLEAAAVAAGWVAALVPGAWEDERVAVVLAAVLAAVAALRWGRAPAQARRDRALAALATGTFSLVVALTATVRLVDPDVSRDWTLAVYELALCAIAAGLAVGLVRARPGTVVTDLLVELAERPSGAQEAALARALGDPSLEVGYWVDREHAYVDGTGRRLDIPIAGEGRAVTRVDRDRERVAVLLHDPAVLDEPGLVEAVRATAGLAAANARLHAEVREQAAAVEASRRRLLRARDEERRRLEVRLRDGAERRLVAIRPVLEAALSTAAADTAERIERAQDRLDATLADLRELAAGLHPRELAEHGLEQAVVSLAGRSPTPVRLAVSPGPLPADVETAVYFVCSEALANAAKYAAASSVEIEVSSRDGAVVVDVTDDGVGGADPASGTGIAGLADRIAALGGTLRVDSPVGGGTRLHAELPGPGVSA